MSIYWASLVRMMYRRALLDAAQADQPLVLLQAADNASGLERNVAFRFLNRPNPYQTDSNGAYAWTIPLSCWHADPTGGKARCR